MIEFWVNGRNLFIDTLLALYHLCSKSGLWQCYNASSVKSLENVKQIYSDKINKQNYPEPPKFPNCPLSSLDHMLY